MIFKVTPTQICHEIPAAAKSGKATIFYVNAVTGEVSTSRIEISQVSPGLMSADGSGTWTANASVVRLRFNGKSVTEPVFQIVHDEIVPIPIDVASNNELVILNIAGTGFRYRNWFSRVGVTIGGTPVPVLYAGAQDGGFGPDRLYVLLPQSLAGRGPADVVMTVDGQTTNTVKINIK